MWLATVISVLFFAEAAWRIALPGSSTPDKAWAYLNAANFILFGLLGLGCVYWPRREAKDDQSPAGAELTVVVDSPAAKDVDTGVKEVENDAPATVEVPPKRQVNYLTNLKTFLTFVVVTHHTVMMFTGGGLGTLDMPSFSLSPKETRSFFTGGLWFTSVNQDYFMATFFLVSGLFCPTSLDRKGFRKFVIDKLVRLGGPWIMWSAFLGPLLQMWVNAYAGLPVTYAYDQGTVWFILWLLNFSIAYAVIAQFVPTVRFGMPHPMYLLLIGAALGGIFYGISQDKQLVMGGTYAYFGNMNFWNYGLAMYIPFFSAGIVGGRNDWLKSVEGMKTWVVWSLRVIVVGFWVIIFLGWAQKTIPIPELHMDMNIIQYFIPPVYAVPMTLAIMQFFHQYFNATPQSKFMRSTGLAAYMVYVIQFWPMQLAMLVFVEILKAAGVPLVLEEKTLFTTGADGQPVLLSDGIIWGGWVFVFVLTQLILWPLCFYLRKLPVLNKMF